MNKLSFKTAGATLILLGTILGSEITEAQTVSRIAVAPSTVQIAIGARTSVVATAYGANDGVVPATFTWSSTNLSVARVTFDNTSSLIGNIEGVAAGLAQIEVRAGNAVGTVTVQVGGAGGASASGGGNVPQSSAGAAVELRLEPRELLLLPGETFQVGAAFLNSSGTPAVPEPVTWVSRQLAIADVEANGNVTGLSDGTAIIQAVTDGGLSGRVIVEVQRSAIQFESGDKGMAPGLIDTAFVVVPAQNNRTVSPRLLTWTSSNPAVARVSPLGIISSESQGTTEIVASGFRQEVRFNVIVHRPVSLLDWLPSASSPVNVPIQGDVLFDVRALDANEVPVEEATLEWEVGDTTIIAFDPATKIASGLKLGETTLKASAPGRGRLEVEWTINVIEGGVMLSTNRVGLRVGDQATVDARFTDNSGNPLGPATGINWASSEILVANVTDDGTIEGTGAGKAVVTGSTNWGSVDSVEVFVQNEIFVSSSRTGTLDVFSFSRNDPGQMTQVTSDPGQVTAASLSPDGTRLVYVSTASGNNDIYVSDADGGNAVVVAGTEFNEDGPDWSSDGSRIVYQSNEGGPPQVWIMNADGSGKTQLTTEGANTSPAFSPEDVIAFTATRDGNYEIYLMNADGSNQRNITNHPNRELNPAWLPDGQVAFLVAGSSIAGGVTQQVYRRDSMGGLSALSPDGLAVTDFAVSREGDLLGMIVSEITADGQTNKLFLQRLETNSGPVEIRTNDPNERFFGVSFRR